MTHGTPVRSTTARSIGHTQRMETLDLWITADADVDYRSGYVAPTVVARGNCKSRMMSPREFSLWSLTAELEAGVELEWTATHGDEAVYVKKGSLTIDGRVCPVDGEAQNVVPNGRFRRGRRHAHAEKVLLITLPPRVIFRGRPATFERLFVEHRRGNGHCMTGRAHRAIDD